MYKIVGAYTVLILNYYILKSFYFYMRKMMKKFLVLLLMLFFANVAFAVNSYDRYGQKTGSYRQTTSATILMTDTVQKLARIRKHHWL